MKNSLYFIITAIFAFCASCSSAQPKLENSLLWKISGNGLKEESYLFGTNHGVHHSFLDSVNGFWNAYNSAKNIVVEYDVTSLSTNRSFFDVLKKEDILLPKDSTYKVLYNAEDYKIVDEYMNAHGFGHLSGVNAKPALMNMVISFMMLNSDKQDINSQAETNMEPYMLNLAKKKNKNIMQLDDFEKIGMGKAFALEFGFTTPLQKQADALLELIKSEDAIMKFRSTFAQYYKQQNLEMMDELNEIMREMSPKTYDMLLNNRNDIWMESIPDILQSGSSLIAVGVRHLVGEDGLISLLRKAGYTVEPVISNNEEGTYQIEDLLADAEEITFELHKNLLYIDATIADSVKSKFIFDTGALYLVLDSTLYANNFGRVDTLMKAVTSGVGENREYAHLSKGIWSYQLGNVKHREKNAAVMNLKKIIDNNDVGGIVGAIFMRNRNIVVDYQNSKIYLLKPESQNKKIGNSAKGYYKNRSFTPYITLDLYINDSIKISGDFLLDIGSSYTISLTSKTAKDYNLESVITHLEEEENYSVGGKYKYRTFMADSASIAGYTIRNIEADYSLSKAGALSNTPYLGLVGNGFLKNFMLQIDFESGRVWLRPYDHKE